MEEKLILKERPVIKRPLLIVQECYKFWGNSSRWKPVCKSGVLHMFPCFNLSLVSYVLDINECETRNFTCTLQQTCFNIPGEYKCLDPVRCEDPYIQINEKWVTYPQPQKQILSVWSVPRVNEISCIFTTETWSVSRELYIHAVAAFTIGKLYKNNKLQFLTRSPGGIW